MKVPLSWLREFTPVPTNLSHEELENAFVSVGFEVEEIIEQGSDLTGPLVVGEVLSAVLVEGQKKPIRYVGLDCGEGETRYVICGATNFEVGARVVVSLPGAVLPGGFEIAARQTYGHTSNGMICSGRELGISEDHAGIIVLNEGKPGDDALQLLQIKDTIVDVAVNPDRGYALSIRGLAREIAASLNLPFSDPALAVDASKYATNTSGVQVSIDDPTAASVIWIRTIKDFNPEVKSPVWMQRRIEKCGMRSISLAVDITNYVMLELGQPLHAFDASKIDGSLHIRRANQEKTFTTLDNAKRDLDPTNLVVSDDKKALALAGTMGGLESEVTASTTSIALEAARFDPITVAKNSRFHKLSSEASRRLERATDPALSAISSARAIDLLVQLGGAQYVGSATDGAVPAAVTIAFDPNFPQSLLGVPVSLQVVEEKLQIVGCTVEKSSEAWKVTAPTWRSDLLTPTDLVEEVARLVGLNAIEGKLPIGPSAATLSPIQYRKRYVSASLAAKGYTEVYNYPFVAPEMVETLGFVGPRAASFRIANPMSDAAPLLRTHLLPGLLEALKRNISRGAKDVALFEIGTVFRDTQELAKPAARSIDTRPTDAEIKEIYASVPAQPLFVGAVVAGSLDRSGWWGKGRSYEWSDAIAEALAIVEATGAIGEVLQSELAPWHPGRCAEIKVNGKPVAHAGELHPRVLEALGLPARTCAFAVILSELEAAKPAAAPRVVTMPAATQDISLFVGKDVPAAVVEKALSDGAGELLEKISLIDRFQREGEERVSLTFSLSFRSADRTLTAEEVSEYRARAIKAAEAACQAEARI